MRELERGRKGRGRQRSRTARKCKKVAENGFEKDGKGEERWKKERSGEKRKEWIEQGIKRVQNKVKEGEEVLRECPRERKKRDKKANKKPREETKLVERRKETSRERTRKITTEDAHSEC